MAEQAALDLLRRLARDFNVRDARKLYQIAKREFPDQPAVTVNRAREALRGDVARQVLAPKPRSLGKSAAEGPNDRLQADLIDFSQKPGAPRSTGLVVTDVFTREAVTRALPNKNAETVARAAGGDPRAGAGGRQLRGDHGRRQGMPRWWIAQKFSKGPDVAFPDFHVPDVKSVKFVKFVKPDEVDAQSLLLEK